MEDPRDFIATKTAAHQQAQRDARRQEAYLTNLPQGMHGQVATAPEESRSGVIGALTQRMLETVGAPTRLASDYGGYAGNIAENTLPGTLDMLDRGDIGGAAEAAFFGGGSKALREAEWLAQMAKGMKKDPMLFHPVGGGPKLSRPFDELTASYRDTGPMLPQRDFDPAEAQGSLLVPLYGDKTMAGKTLTGLNDVPLPREQELGGGARFMQENPGSIWASDKGAITNLTNRVRAFQDKTGKDVYGVHVAMGPRGGDFARMTTRPLMDMLQRSPMSGAGAEAVDDVMTSKAKKVAWPGLENLDDDWLARAPGGNRAALAKLLSLSQSQQAGAPDVGALRKAITEPDLWHAPMTTTGMTVGKFDPGAPMIFDPTKRHDTYPVQAAGSYQGDLGLLPFADVFPDFAKTRPTGEQLPQLGRSIMTMPVVQEANQQWLDNLMRRHQTGGRE